MARGGYQRQEENAIIGGRRRTETYTCGRLANDSRRLKHMRRQHGRYTREGHNSGPVIMIDRVQATRGHALSRALRETLILYQAIFNNLQEKKSICY